MSKLYNYHSNHCFFVFGVEVVIYIAFYCALYFQTVFFFVLDTSWTTMIKFTVNALNTDYIVLPSEMHVHKLM